MDSLFDQTKEYTVQPGCRYAIAYEGTAGAAAIVVGWVGDAETINQFPLADGTTTEDLSITGEGHSGGWEVLAVTNKIHATATGSVNVTLVRVEN
jgi:hypothetical protein